jgi:ABC-type nickel/cobalt efflux system permease component RcnA
MDATTVAALSLGFVYGLRHALDPDHMVAVTTIVSQHKSIVRSSLVGTFWGLGHTISIFAVGLVVLLLKVSIPRTVELWLEMAVALMLVVLGMGVLIRALKESGIVLHSHPHSHNGELPHEHLHVHSSEAHIHRHRIIRLGRKPFVVGMIHGMAGSAAVTVAVLTTIPSVALGLAYIALFGLGSIGGMLLMSAMIGLPFAVTAGRLSSMNLPVRMIAGLLSLGFGLFLGWGLFSTILNGHP